MDSTDSRIVIGPSNTLFGGVHVCTFQPGNFTGCGSEGVNKTVSLVIYLMWSIMSKSTVFQKDLLQPLSKQEVSYWILRVTSQQSANLKILLVCLKLQILTLLVCSKLCKFQNSSCMVKSLHILTLLVCSKVCKFQNSSSCKVKSLQIWTLLVWSKACKFQLFLYGQKSANFNSSCMFKSLQISKLLFL